jgi:hypothetical protein
VQAARLVFLELDEMYNWWDACPLSRIGVIVASRRQIGWRGIVVGECEETEKGAEYEAYGDGEDEMAAGTMPGEKADHSPRRTKLRRCDADLGFIPSTTGWTLEGIRRKIRANRMCEVASSPTAIHRVASVLR